MSIKHLAVRMTYQIRIVGVGCPKFCFIHILPEMIKIKFAKNIVSIEQYIGHWSSDLLCGSALYKYKEKW